MKKCKEEDPDYKCEKKDKAEFIESKYRWSFIERVAKEVEAKKNRAKVARRRNKDYDEVRKIEQRYQQGPSEAYKITKLKEQLKIKFESARSIGLQVHDYILIEWINQLKLELKIEKFDLTGHTFIENFKKDNGIVSRHVTKFVKVTKLKNFENLKKVAYEFNEKINKKVDECSIDWKNVVNSDQTKLNFEMVSNRTLSHKGKLQFLLIFRIYSNFKNNFAGEKDTYSTVNSLNAITHSFTLQLTIAANGDVAPYIFVCFQETKGQFGKNVLKEIQKLVEIYKNVVAVPSASGKVGKNHIKVWYENALKPSLNGEFFTRTF